MTDSSGQRRKIVSPGDLKIWLYEIAKAQRFVWQVFLLVVVVTIAAAVMQQIHPTIVVVLVGIQVLLSFAQVIAMFRLGRVVYDNVAHGILMGVLALIPCFGVCALLMANSRATAILRTHGHKVGLMGADLNQFG